jgi:hypothetical protein
MTDLRELLARVESAKGADRELDAAIHCELITDADLRVVSGRLLARSRHAPFDEWVALATSPPVPSYTASLDAVAALAERVRPGVSWYLRVTPIRGSRTIYSANFTDAGENRRREGATPVLALLAALLRSLTEGEAGGGAR